MKEEKIPKGLVWSTRPSFSRNNEAFLKKWRNFQHSCSLHLVELLIEELEQETRTLLIAAKNKQYNDAEKTEEADKVLAFVKELVDKCMDFANKKKQSKLDADLAGKPRRRERKPQ